jgi:hypothetical protein
VSPSWNWASRLGLRSACLISSSLSSFFHPVHKKTNRRVGVGGS